LIRPGEIAKAAEQLQQRLPPGRLMLAWSGGAAAIEFGAKGLLHGNIKTRIQLISSVLGRALRISR
jgi:hypothetical protein